MACKFAVPRGVLYGTRPLSAMRNTSNLCAISASVSWSSPEWTYVLRRDSHTALFCLSMRAPSGALLVEGLVCATEAFWP